MKAPRTDDAEVRHLGYASHSLATIYNATYIQTGRNTVRPVLPIVPRLFYVNGGCVVSSQYSFQE
jgi:hypothetical protein